MTNSVSEDDVAAAEGTSVPVGTIVATICDTGTRPANWLPCDGSDIPAQYTQLCALLASNQTPNLAGRTLIGSGTLPTGDVTQSDGLQPQFSAFDQDALIARRTGGECVHKLTTSEMPKHSHTINDGDFGIHHRSFKGSDGSDKPFETNNDDTSVKSTDPTGDGDTHNTLQPYYVVNYLIYAGTS